jgi:hypothetical protein
MESTGAELEVFVEGECPISPIIATRMKIPKHNATTLVNPLVNLWPHFGQELALFATSFPHSHFRMRSTHWRSSSHDAFELRGLWRPPRRFRRVNKLCGS